MRKVLPWLLAVFAFLIAVVLISKHRYPATLLQRSHRVATLGAWQSEYSSYFWLPGGKVLLLGTGPTSGYAAPPVHVEQCDVAAGTRSDMTALESILSANRLSGHVSNWQVSPDGHWLLAENSLDMAPYFWYAVNLTDGRIVRRPRQRDQEEFDLYSKKKLIHACWRQDSKGWVQLIQGASDNKAHIFSYEIGATPVQEHIEDFMTYERNVLGFYSPDRVVAVKLFTGDKGSVSFADFSGVPTTTPRALYFQSVPANFNVREAALSPHADRIAWEFEIRPVPLGISALRESNYVRSEQPIMTALYTSKLDCSDLHQVGTLDIRDGKPANLRWTPDAGSLSFVYQGGLYTVPAN